MDIKTAIASDLCIICQNENELRKLAPYFRGSGLSEETIKSKTYPCYCYSPISAFRGSIGLGFNSKDMFAGKKLSTINASELSD